MTPPRPGVVYFIGAGPGAPDLLTLRARNILSHATLVLYADSLVHPGVLAFAAPTARIEGTSGLTLPDIVARMVAEARRGGIVARVHSGDPALYGALAEQTAALDEAGVPYDIVPGVSSLFAAAACLKRELTVPGVAQSVILTRAAGRTGLPRNESLRAFAAHGTTLAIFLSVSRMQQVVDDLLASGGYTPDTPAAVVYRATWEDEQVVRGTLRTITDQVRAAGFTRQALILVGDALSDAPPPATSHLYAPEWRHRFRPQGTPVERPVQTAAATLTTTHVIAVSRDGSRLAHTVANSLGASAWVPRRFADEAPQALPFDGRVRDLLAHLWPQSRRIVLIMPVGAATRLIAPHLRHKHHDPAVVVCDDTGRFVVPLVGGHVAGANALAHTIADCLHATPVITTASDCRGLPSPDLLGREREWRIAPHSALTQTAAALVNGEPLGLFVEPDLPDEAAYLAERLAALPREQCRCVETPAALFDLSFGAVLVVSHRVRPEWEMACRRGVLYRPPVLVVGVGCRRGVPVDDLDAAVRATLAQAGLAPDAVRAFATAAIKADEPGIHHLAERWGVPVEMVEHAALQALTMSFSPSAATRFGLPGVAEPAAVAVARGPLLVRKQRFKRCTVAVALAQSARRERCASTS
nr:precorrin-4 C(11)-methyltransferase [Ardenticatena sp.]